MLTVWDAATRRPGPVRPGFLTQWVEPFGFHLPFTSGLAAFVLVVEIVAVVLLAATALIMIRPQAVR